VSSLVCSYDLQVGLWPNLSKANNHKMASGDILIDFFQNIIYIKPILMFPSL
jgi:hypothetical protein